MKAKALYFRGKVHRGLHMDGMVTFSLDPHTTKRPRKFPMSPPLIAQQSYQTGAPPL